MPVILQTEFKLTYELNEKERSYIWQKIKAGNI